MRTNLLLVLLLAAAFCVGPIAQAAAEPPPFEVEALRPSEDTPLTGGWTLSEDEPENLSEQMEALAEEAKYDTFALAVEAFRIQHEKSSSLDVAMLDLDEDPAPLRKVLDARAKQEGWAIHELGSPQRLLVLIGGDKAKAKRAKEHKQATSALLLHVAHRFGDIALELAEPNPDSGVARRRQLKNVNQISAAVASLGIEGGIVDAVAYVAATVPRDRIKKLVGESKQMVMAWWGDEKNRAHYRKEYEQLKAELAPLKKPCEALALKAVTKGRANRPTGRLLIDTIFEASNPLWREGSKASWTKIEHLLKEGIALVDSGATPSSEQLLRYNLACVYGLLGKTKEAVPVLQESFELAEAVSQDLLGHWYVSALSDKDLTEVIKTDAGKQVMEAVRGKVETIVAPYLKRMAELKSQGYDLDD